jgi:hypothetical protein
LKKTTWFQMQDILVHGCKKNSITMFPFEFIMII